VTRSWLALIPSAATTRDCWSGPRPAGDHSRRGVPSSPAKDTPTAFGALTEQRRAILHRRWRRHRQAGLPPSQCSWRVVRAVDGSPSVDVISTGQRASLAVSGVTSLKLRSFTQAAPHRPPESWTGPRAQVPAGYSPQSRQQARYPAGRRSRPMHLPGLAPPSRFSSEIRRFMTDDSRRLPRTAQDSDIQSRHIQRAAQPTRYVYQGHLAPGLHAPRPDGSWLMFRAGYLVLVRIRIYNRLTWLPRAA
jgi:hypothetical protein